MSDLIKEKAEISEEEEMEKRQELKQMDQKEAPTNTGGSDHQELHPESYRINSPAETRLMTLVETFQLQYLHQYPDRCALLLCPLNECGVRKFVSTTIRPTATGCCDLQTWQGCAALVADLLMLEPLDPPTELPSQLFSSTSVLRRQKGTCFEFATLLCSLLLGISYDAYCVSGYADRQVCLLDRSQERCPLLDNQQKVSEQKQPENKYGLRRARNRSSHFLKQQEEKNQETRAQKQELQEEAQRAPSVHSLHGSRVHCWVLVLSGSSNVQENFFIDPLTGNSYTTDNQHFLGIESVWNHLNYYVNMQVCSSGCNEVKFDLEDLNLWEPVLFGSTSKKQLILQVQRRKENGPEAPQAALPRAVEMPRSWVGSISMSEKDQVRRWPEGKKVTRFRKAKLEKFLPGVNADGLVTRLTSYRDLDCSEVAVVKEWYDKRKDHLEEKEINKLDGFISERFSHNKSTKILFYRRKSLPSGAERDVTFGCKRKDHLVRRVMLPREIVDHFENRNDLLYYRRVCFNQQLESSPQVSDVLTIVERFHRNTFTPANEDVAEREFLMSLSRIELTFHLMDRHFIRSKMSFRIPQANEKFKPDQVSVFQVDESVKPLRGVTLFRMLSDLIEELQQLFGFMKDFLSEVSEIIAFIEQRQKEAELSPEEPDRQTEQPLPSIDRINLDVLQQNPEELQTIQNKSSSQFTP